MLVLSPHAKSDVSPKEPPKEPEGSTPTVAASPALACGHGKFSVDGGKPMATALDDHECVVRDWLKKLEMDELVTVVKSARDHPDFDHFGKDLNRTYGSYEDFMEFEMWLAKLHLSRMIPAPSATPKSAPASGNGSGKGAKSKASADALPVLTPEQKQAYQDYWKQWESSEKGPDQASPSDSPSPAESDENVTPACKRKLEWEGGQRFAEHFVFSYFCQIC